MFSELRVPGREQILHVGGVNLFSVLNMIIALCAVRLTETLPNPSISIMDSLLREL